MKKIFCLFLTALFLLGAISSSAASVLESSTQNDGITESEVKTIKGQLVAREMIDSAESDFSIDLLYNKDDEAEFILAVTSCGYIIYDRTNRDVWECGTVNPYYNNMAEKKYYCGPMEYYIKNSSSKNENEEFYNVVTNSYAEKLLMSQYLDSSVNRKNVESSKGTITKRVQGWSSNIQRRAFGYNERSSCTAVAFGIALNYIRLKYGLKVVPKIHETMNNGIARNTADLKSKYPNAYSVHLKLLNAIGEEAIGGNVVKNLERLYFPKVTPSSQRPTVTARWWPSFSMIKENIDANKPVVITTTIFGGIQWHSMAVYGYREVSGTNELLVHTGWHCAPYMKPVYPTGNINEDEVYHSDFWINANLARYAYFFTLPNE